MVAVWLLLFVLLNQRQAAIRIASGFLSRLSARSGSFFERRASLFVEGMEIFSQGPAVLRSILLTTLAWSTTAFAWFILGRSLGLDLLPHAYWLPVGVTFLASALPGLPGRLGTFEFLVVWTLGLLSVGASQALSLSILVRACRLLPMAAGYALLVRAGMGWSDLRPAISALDTVPR